MISKHSTYSVKGGVYPEKVNVPSSKSYANRLLVLAAITPGPFTVRGLTPSTDVLSMLGALRSIGLEVDASTDGSVVVIKNSFPGCESLLNSESVELETGDGGTTNRFLLALLAHGAKKYSLKTTGRMAQRPASEFFEALKELGVSLQSDNAEYWCEIQGPITLAPNLLKVDCSRSTQFATALKLSLVGSDVEIVPQNMSNSLDYWRLTEYLVELYQGGQRDFTVPVDFSSLTYPLALGFCAGEIKVSNCFQRDEFQADVRFLDFLQQAGAEVKFTADGLHLLSNLKLARPIEVSVASCPDLTPTLAFVCSLIEGTSRLRDVEVLRHKESDRVAEIMNVLKKMGVNHHYDSKEDSLVIEGKWPRAQRSGALVLPDDHRIIMMAYLFLNASGGGELNNAAHVEKSFPNFFKVMSGE